MRTSNGNLEWKPGKKPPNLIRETGEEKRETTKNILARREADKSQRVILLLKNFPTQ